MNIFVTSKCPIQSAKNLDDKRVIKMCTESLQLLCTALVKHGVDPEQLPMKSTHSNHPASKWTRTSRSNFIWLCDHFDALCKEKQARYPENKPYKHHKAAQKIRQLANKIGDIGLTPFANCAANKEIGLDYRHIQDVTLAYQLYLNDRWDADKREPTWYRETK